MGGQLMAAGGSAGTDSWDTHTWPLHVMLAFHSMTAGF